MFFCGQIYLFQKYFSSLQIHICTASRSIIIDEWALIYKIKKVVQLKSVFSRIHFTVCCIGGEKSNTF